MSTETLENDAPGHPEPALDPSAAGEETGSISRVHKLTEILRKTGAIVLVAAALSFLIQGWNNWNSLERYYTFLGFTGSLAALGMLCGLALKDSKGARTFLAIATAFIPVHFAQLGAFVHSLFGSAEKYFPKSLVFVADSPTSVLLTTGVTTLLAFPLALVGFSTLGRSKGRYLTLLYLAANALLLIPVRDSQTVFVIAAVMFIGLLFSDLSMLASVPGLKTFEGRCSRLLLFVPFSIMLGRCAMYGPSLYILSIVLGAVACLLYLYAPKLYENPSSARNLRLISLIPAYFSWRCLVGACLHNGFGDLPGSLVIHLPYAALLALLSLNAQQDGPLLRRIAGIMAIAATLSQLFVFGGFTTAVLAVFVSLLVLSAAFALEERVLFYAGGFGFVSGLLYHLQYALRFYQLSPWLSLAAIGVAAVVASSYVERNYQRILAWGSGFKSSFQTWQ